MGRGRYRGGYRGRYRGGYRGRWQRAVGRGK